ncbi:MAG: ABC transporter permease [Pseudomonadota bacterium]
MSAAFGRGLAAAAVAIGLWQFIVWAGDMKHFILPGPWRVATALWANAGLIFENALVTFGEVLLGLVLGVALGAVSAIQLAGSPMAQTLLRPILIFLQAVPVFALAPVLTIWFGYGIWSKVAMALLIIYFPVMSAFYDGLTRTPQGFVDLARCMGASPARIMWHVRIPAAIPSLASGLRLAAVYAPIGAVIGEWVGASQGLGHLMLLANGRAKIDLMFAALFVLAAFTVVLHMTIDRLADRLTTRMSDAAA